MGHWYEKAATHLFYFIPTVQFDRCLSETEDSVGWSFWKILIVRYYLVACVDYVDNGQVVH